jgi:ABC-type glycerol-3-phosphate transport system substrate-binding protein
MKLYSPSPLLLALGAATVLLAACGDSSTVAAPSTNEIPTSATTSSAGAFTFVNSVASANQDTAEPLLDGDSVLATSDTDEPDQSV